MPVPNRLAAMAPDMTEWRRDLHAHPELGLEEHRTSEIVAAKLAAWGIAVHRGLARTGVVGTLKVGSSPRAIGIRADMDALAMEEANDVPHRSRHPGRMHACGHDGHTAMLLGAAKYLAETRNFDGTVHFIFQPAEEGLGGGRIMVEEGLFDLFPCDRVYGAHNDYQMPVGEMAVAEGRSRPPPTGSRSRSPAGAAMPRGRTRRSIRCSWDRTSCWRCRASSRAGSIRPIRRSSRSRSSMPDRPAT